MILYLLNTLSAIVLLYDTLGHVAVHFKNHNTEEATEDYKRLTYTWIFYFAFKTLCCLSCCMFGDSFLGSIFFIVYTLARLFVVLPIVGGTRILQKMVFEDEVLTKTAKGVISMVQSKLNPQSANKEE